MSPVNPYLLRAIHEWILDNGCTPYILVAATGENVVVPQHLVKDGSIILNVSPSAVRDLEFGTEYVSFSARFGGNAYDIAVPITAVRAIYTKENGQGIVLAEEDGVDKATSAQRVDGAHGKTPHLTVVK